MPSFKVRVCRWNDILECGDSTESENECDFFVNLLNNS